MALNIKDPKTDELAREVAIATGQSITQAVNTALQEKLDRIRRASVDHELVEDLTRIAARVSALPDLDRRSNEDVIGYDEHGVPN